jgi:glycosyltransferase involved in cell wall biosynthesis
MIQSLNLAYTLPYPARSGYDLRVWNLCSCMGPRIRHTLLCRHQEEMGPACTDAFREKGIDLHSLYLPAPGRMLKLAKGLRSLLSPYPVMSAGWMFPEMKRSLTDLLNARSFDLVVFEGIWLGAYWPLIARSGALKVLNHYDLEALSLRRQASVMRPGFEKVLFLHDARRMQIMEDRIIRAADWVWVTSEREKHVLLGRYPNLPVGVAPNGVDCQAKIPIPPVASHELLFVGCMRHFPNVDAVRYFTREVFPLLRLVVPDVTFRIIGRGTGPDIQELAKIPGVIVTGEVVDLLPYYQRCAACVVPLRSGGGTRLKILECMAYGRPVVSTSLGAEGIEIKDGVHYLLGDTPLAMIEAIRRILTTPGLAADLVSRARTQVEAKYAWTTIADGMVDRYRMLLSARERSGV